MSAYTDSPPFSEIFPDDGDGHDERDDVAADARHVIISGNRYTRRRQDTNRIKRARQQVRVEVGHDGAGIDVGHHEPESDAAALGVGGAALDDGHGVDALAGQLQLQPLPRVVLEPGHVFPEGERVLDTHDRFWVVEKEDPWAESEPGRAARGAVHHAPFRGRVNR